MAEHTKLPWKVWEQSPSFIETEDGAPITCMTLGANYQPHEYHAKMGECYANARFIVRAVNAHEQLVAALTFYMAICGNTAYQVSRQSAQEAYALGQAALRAAGEASDDREG